MTEPVDPLHPPGALRRTILRLAVILVLAWGIHLLFDWASVQAHLADGQLRMWMLALFVLVYALLIAVPFVPGVEVGLALMAMEGPWIAPWIYVATAAGLIAAFAGGEGFSYPRLQRILADLRMGRARRLIEKVQPLGKEERLSLLQARAPRWAKPFVSQFRYVLLAALINLPGNTLIGGGGGLLFLAGFSRLFHLVPMVVTILLAVGPVPLAVWLFDVDVRTIFPG
ncbi:MAG: hypothetical protein HC844_21260 [Tabrizicola sp.]|nr:hypothetical protein [Tabrizicola sp.]